MTSTDFSTAVLQEKKSNQNSIFPSWGHGCLVGVYPKRRGQGELWGSLSVHSSVSLSSHGVQQGSKLQRQTAFCCLEHTRGCNELTEGGVAGKGKEYLLLISQMLNPSHSLISCQIFRVYCHLQQLRCSVSCRFFLEELTTLARPVVHFAWKYLGMHITSRSF